MVITYTIMLAIILTVTYLFSKKQLHRYSRIYILTVSFIVAYISSNYFIEIGTDRVDYRYFYEVLFPKYYYGNIDTIMESPIEIGYILLNKAMYVLGIDTKGMFFIMSFIINFNILYGILRLTNRFYLVSSVWFCSYFYHYTFYGIRQSLAIGLFLFFYIYKQENKNIKSLLFLILSIAFHRTVLVPISLLYFYESIKRIDFKGRKNLWKYIVVLLISLTLLLLSKLLINSGILGAKFNYKLKREDSLYEILKNITKNIYLLYIYIDIILINKQNNEKFNSNGIEEGKFYLLMSCILNLMIFYNYWFYRMIIYLYIFNIIYYINKIYLIENKPRIILKLYIYIIINIVLVYRELYILF